MFPLPSIPFYYLFGRKPLYATQKKNCCITRKCYESMASTFAPPPIVIDFSASKASFCTWTWWWQIAFDKLVEVKIFLVSIHLADSNERRGAETSKTVFFYCYTNHESTLDVYNFANRDELGDEKLCKRVRPRRSSKRLSRESFWFDRFSLFTDILLHFYFITICLMLIKSDSNRDECRNKLKTRFFSINLRSMAEYDDANFYDKICMTWINRRLMTRKLFTRKKRAKRRKKTSKLSTHRKFMGKVRKFKSLAKSWVEWFASFLYGDIIENLHDWRCGWVFWILFHKNTCDYTPIFFTLNYHFIDVTIQFSTVYDFSLQ